MAEETKDPSRHAGISLWEDVYIVLFYVYIIYRERKLRKKIPFAREQGFRVHESAIESRELRDENLYTQLYLYNWYSYICTLHAVVPMSIGRKHDGRRGLVYFKIKNLL